MIRRDRDANETLDDGLEAREYVLQNWRADVVALAAPDGDLLERVTYDAYGIPFATHPTDLTRGAIGGVAGYGMPDGTLNNDDYFYYQALYAATDWRADWDRDGDIDSADNTAYLADKAAASGSWGRGVLSNRQNILGYAGYVHEPATGAAGGGHGTMWHVRHRLLHAGLGRWVQRDPLEYYDGTNIIAYAAGTPISVADSMGLLSHDVCVGVACQFPPLFLEPWELEVEPITRAISERRYPFNGRVCNRRTYPILVCASNYGCQVLAPGQCTSWYWDEADFWFDGITWYKCGRYGCYPTNIAPGGGLGPVPPTGIPGRTYQICDSYCLNNFGSSCNSYTLCMLNCMGSGVQIQCPPGVPGTQVLPGIIIAGD